MQFMLLDQSSGGALASGEQLDGLADLAAPFAALPGVKLTKAQALAIARLRGLIARFRQRAAHVSVEVTLSELLAASGYMAMLQEKAAEEQQAAREGQKSKGKTAAERLRSLELLMVVARCPETYGRVDGVADGEEDEGQHMYEDAARHMTR